MKTCLPAGKGQSGWEEEEDYIPLSAPKHQFILLSKENRAGIHDMANVMIFHPDDIHSVVHNVDILYLIFQ